MRLSFQKIQWLLLVILIVLPLLVRNDFYMDTLIMILIWSAASGAWNITGGYGGLFSLGHAAYFGIGAYTSTLLMYYYHFTPWLGMLIGGVLAASLGLVIGVLTIRLRGPFFTLASIAFTEVLMIIATNWHALTRGSEGVSVPFAPGLMNMSFHGKMPYFYIAFALALIPYLFSRWLNHSKLGYQLVAIREDESAAQALGVNTVKVKLMVTVVSTFLMALAGTIYAQYIGFIDPEGIFSVDLSIQFALMAIIGGMALASGPIVGAILITLLSVTMRTLLGGQSAGLYLVIYALILILVVLFVPQGIVPWLSEKYRGFKRRKLLKEGDHA